MTTKTNPESILFAVYDEGDESVGIWGIDRDDMPLAEAVRFIAGNYNLQEVYMMDDFITDLIDLIALSPGEMIAIGDTRFTRQEPTRKETGQ